MSCTYIGIDKSLDKCAFVKENCTDFNTVDFFDIRYCKLGDSPNSHVFFLTWVIFCIFVSFYLLSTISDKYLSPSLSMLSKKLKMSEAMAGVTILAFANGAPDIIASFAAGGDENGGVFISVGSLFGGCLFSATFVVIKLSSM